MLLLGQNQSNLDKDLGSLTLSETTVLEHVVKSNQKRERLLHEEQVLSSAIEHKEPTEAVRAYRTVCHGRLERKLHEAKQIALRRSGARGIKSRQVLNHLEEELKQSEQK